MLKIILRGLGLLLIIVFIILMLTYAVIWGLTDYRLDKAYPTDLEPVEVPTDAESLANGERLTIMRGCVDCHGDDLRGMVMIDQGGLGYIESANLTTGENGAARTFTDDDWVRAIRHGIDPKGRALVLMPSSEYYYLNDDDLGDLIAYLKTAPPVDTQPGKKTRVDLVIRATWTFMPELPLLSAELIDHSGPRPDAIEPGITVEYGQYLAITCVNCHGEGFSGGDIPGRPREEGAPIPANLTPNTETGLGNWAEDDFVRAIREGKRPDGTTISDAMPWKHFALMTDDELSALWLFLESLPVKEAGNR